MGDISNGLPLQSNGLLNFIQQSIPYDSFASNVYETKLDPKQEQDFRKWKSKFAPNDTGTDYDLRGAYLAGFKPDPKTQHWPDTYKKPNHPTFSNQSIYAPFEPQKAGSWNGDNYIAPRKDGLMAYINF